MEQYKLIKKDHPNSILLFQIQDQYYSYYSDAKKVSELKEAMTITKAGVLTAVINSNNLAQNVAKLRSKGNTVMIVNRRNEVLKTAA